MKKKKNSLNNLSSVIKSLKKLRVTKTDEKLLASAHQLLNLQLESLKKSISSSDSSTGIIFYDSRILPLPEGVRPAAVETARLKFKIGTKELQVSLYPISSERYEVIGHLSGITHGKILFVNLKRNKKRTTTKTNEFQIFRFNNVQKAPYELEINDGKSIIAEIELSL